MFVKVNMDGVPIGRKIDIKAYDSYDKLSQSLEEMFKRFINGMPLFLHSWFWYQDGKDQGSNITMCLLGTHILTKVWLFNMSHFSHDEAIFYYAE